MSQIHSDLKGQFALILGASSGFGGATGQELAKADAAETLARLSTVAAAGAQGWMTKHVSPGLLEATFRQKTHVAVVEIGFDKDKWTIVYKTSEHLNQDGNRIHPHYNAWIQKLERNINYKLSSVAP